MDQNADFVILEHWSVVSCMDKNAPYCKPEETDMENIHLKGVGHVIYNGDSVVELKGALIKITRITSCIKDVKEVNKDGKILKVFFTTGHGYILGEPNPEFVSVWKCGLAPSERLFEVMVKKKQL